MNANDYINRKNQNKHVNYNDRFFQTIISKIFSLLHNHIIGYYTRRWSETGPEYLEAIYYWLKASINQDRGKRERERERDLSTSKWYIWERLENVILFGFNCNKMDWNVCVLILNIFLKRQIDDNQEKYVKRLADTVAIKSVSAWPETRPDITTMIEWTKVVSSYFICSVWFMNN